MAAQYEHKPNQLTENDALKFIWDMKLQSCKVIEHSRPGIVRFHKTTRECKVIDVSCPFDTQVLKKERKKMGKYQALKWEIK